MPKITIHVIPRASTSEIVSRGSGVWRIRIAAPPVDGRANEALIRLLADEFDCAPSEVTIAKGGTSKTKIVEVP